LDHHPLRAGKSEGFQALIKDANTTARLYSQTTYQRDLLSTMQVERVKLHQLLACHQGKFNFTTDAWSDDEWNEYMGK
jgi:hypothetical protein